MHADRSTEHRLFHVDAFTEAPYAGNPAGVVLGPPLPEEAMQRIAAELNLSETAFPVRPTSAAADLRIRWFTPSCEVDFCGHATLAALHVLRTAERGFLAPARGWPGPPETGRARIEVRGAPLEVAFEPDGSIHFETPREDFAPMTNHEVDRLVAALGLTRDDLASLPVERSESGNTMLPVRTLEALRAARPRFDALTALDRELHLFGHTLLTPQTVDIGSRVHVRYFAPSHGVAEDPVTGSANGLVGRYLARHDVITVGWQRGQAAGYVAEQGDHMSKRGRVHVRLQRVEDVGAGGSAPPRSLASWIGGHAVTVFTAPLAALPRPAAPSHD